ncbi:MAG: hypothetical protein KME42_28295 [Tildeniella nuda ZEHNDER 1965/U140]|jgi:hypothetical protein|nr:hypothetical protein [Tildeniella nuda ZEHNDER 1965/U140]
MTIALLILLALPTVAFCQAAIGYWQTTNKLKAISDIEADRRQLEALYQKSPGIEK